jgi:hypothetical protein
MPRVTCPECDRKSRIPAAMLSTRMQCVGCGAVFEVENPEPAPGSRSKRRRGSRDWRIGLASRREIAIGLAVLVGVVVVSWVAASATRTWKRVA